MPAPENSPTTLADVLYRRHEAGTLVPESDWTWLVQSVAAGEELALQALYERTHRIVYTLILRLTSDPDIAEELTLELFLGLWRDAASYDPSDGTVVAWIMNRTRTSAMQRACTTTHGGRFEEQGRALRTALLALTREERQAIEAAFFGDAPYADARMQAHQIRSGLHRLSDLLTVGKSEEDDTCHCGRTRDVCRYALQAVSANEAAAIEAHLGACAECERELDLVRPIVDGFAAWPTDVLCTPWWLQKRLAMRVAAETGEAPVMPWRPQWRAPQWEEVAAGISCKLLATDRGGHTVSMLVRLAPGGSYPRHVHAGVEQLYLVGGELWINESKLYPGAYNRGEPGTTDKRVWSESGCTCVLVTSTQDRLL